MGITIDDAIHDTEVMKEYLEHRDEPRSEGLGVLINIAHKYQKIEQIVKDDWYKPYQNSETLRRISEVLEDGKID